MNGKTCRQIRRYILSANAKTYLELKKEYKKDPNKVSGKVRRFFKILDKDYEIAKEKWKGLNKKEKTEQREFMISNTKEVK